MVGKRERKNTARPWVRKRNKKEQEKKKEEKTMRLEEKRGSPEFVVLGVGYCW